VTYANCAVDAACVASGGTECWASAAGRVAFLFDLYQRLTSLLPAAGRQGRRRHKATG
jgi:hypothetical protein